MTIRERLAIRRTNRRSAGLAAGIAASACLALSVFPANANAATDNLVWAPSGQAMPVGNMGSFDQVYADNFANMDFPVGSFTGCNRHGCGGAPGTGIGASTEGTPDTHRMCAYEPRKVLSIEDGVLTFHVHTGWNGVCDVANVYPLAPAIRYGEYSVRFRADALIGYHLVDLLWPTNATDGEIDFPETNLGNTFNGFLHRYAGGQPFDYFFSTVDNGQWHTATTQWTPDGVSFYLDGVKLPQFGPGIPAPRTPHTLALRVESGEGVLLNVRPAPSVSGTVQIDWVTMYQYTPGG